MNRALATQDEDEVLSESCAQQSRLLSPFNNKKTVKPLDPTRLGNLMTVKNGLERNIPGTLINGTVLRSPVPIHTTTARSESTDQAENPSVKELDDMHKSFKPGMTQAQRYTLQDRTSFYRT